MYPNIQILKQKLAYEFRIIGLPKSPTENQQKSNSFVASIKDHSFPRIESSQKEVLSLDDFKTLNTKFIWTAKRVKDLNKAFQGLCLHVNKIVLS